MGIGVCRIDAGEADRQGRGCPAVSRQWRSPWSSLRSMYRRVARTPRPAISDGIGPRDHVGQPDRWACGREGGPRRLALFVEQIAPSPRTPSVMRWQPDAGDAGGMKLPEFHVPAAGRPAAPCRGSSPVLISALRQLLPNARRPAPPVASRAFRASISSGSPVSMDSAVTPRQWSSPASRTRSSAKYSSKNCACGQVLLVQRVQQRVAGAGCRRRHRCA